MLRSGAIQSLRALLALADDPGRWLSVAELARLQDLPAARLEQLLLRLRRAGVLEARRGRRGGYRLARPAAELSLALIFQALEASLPGAALPWSSASASISPSAPEDAGTRVTAALDRRLQRALERELAQTSLEDLHHDLRSARALLSDDGGLLLG